MKYNNTLTWNACVLLAASLPKHDESIIRAPAPTAQDMNRYALLLRLIRLFNVVMRGLCLSVCDNSITYCDYVQGHIAAKFGLDTGHCRGRHLVSPGCCASFSHTADQSQPNLVTIKLLLCFSKATLAKFL